MRVDPSTQRHIDDHLQRAEFSLRVVASFACLEGTPASEKVGIAQARIAEARVWVKMQLPVAMETPMKPGPLPSAALLLRRRRMGIH
jgi:hypothetical protein